MTLSAVRAADVDVAVFSLAAIATGLMHCKPDSRAMYNPAGLATSAEAIGEGAASILRKGGAAEAPIAQEGLRLLAALLRGCPDYHPPQEDLRFLLTWAFGDLAAAAHRATPFAFLRAILGRRAPPPPPPLFPTDIFCLKTGSASWVCQTFVMNSAHQPLPSDHP